MTHFVFCLKLKDCLCRKKINGYFYIIALFSPAHQFMDVMSIHRIEQQNERDASEDYKTF